MMNEVIPTSRVVQLKDFRQQKPDERAAKLILLSRYGVLYIGKPTPGYDVAWSELPKIPESVKDLMWWKHISE